jgi:hypothetical protein
VKDAAFGFLLHAINDLPVGHLLALDALDDLAANLLAQLAAFLRRPRIRQQRRNQRCPRSSEWPPRRPDVQRRDVPVADVLLVDGIQRRLLERERVFDESGKVGHVITSWSR